MGRENEKRKIKLTKMEKWKEEKKKGDISLKDDGHQEQGLNAT